MTEYIERDVVLSHKWKVRSYDPSDPDPVTEVVSVSSIMQIPAANVVEQKKEHIIEDVGERNICSGCGIELLSMYLDGAMLVTRPNFCPKCGADLREDEYG